jgi:hypothetical protein
MKRNVCAVVLAAGLTAKAPIASAAPVVFGFQPVETSVERGVGVTVKVRVVDGTQNLPVPGVEISDPHVDRSPDGMPNAVLPAFFAPSLDYGVYSFRADFPTNGTWALTFTVKVPGQPQPIAARVNFVVVDPKPPSRSGRFLR